MSCDLTTRGKKEARVDDNFFYYSARFCSETRESIPGKENISELRTR